DHFAFLETVGITFGRDYDTDRGVGLYVEFCASEFATSGVPEKGQDIVLDARQDDLSLGIAEPGVILQDARPLWRQHDADEKCATEIDAFVGDSVDGWADNVSVDLCEEFRCDDLGGR